DLRIHRAAAITAGGAERPFEHDGQVEVADRRVEIDAEDVLHGCRVHSGTVVPSERVRRLDSTGDRGGLVYVGIIELNGSQLTESDVGCKMQVGSRTFNTDRLFVDDRVAGDDRVGGQVCDRCTVDGPGPLSV